MAVAQRCSVRLRRAGMAALTGVSVLTLAVVSTAPATAFGLGSTDDVSRTLDGARRKAEMPPPRRDGAQGREDPQPSAAAPPAPSDPAAPNAAQTASPPEAPAAQPVAPVQSAQPAPQQMTVPAASARTAASSTPPASRVNGGKPAAQDPSGEVLTLPKPDYYAERAKEVLAAERKGEIKPHPLQAASPDYDIMLCEAGCAQPGLQILSKKPRTEAVSATGPEGIVKSPNAGPECIGGCGEPRSDAASYLAPAGQAPRVIDEAAGAWMTSVSPSGAKAHKKVPEVQASNGQAATGTVATDAGPAATLPTATASQGKGPDAKPSQAAPAATAAASAAAQSPEPSTRGTKVDGKSASSAPAKSATSEDWMARINREREAKKAAAGQ